MTAYKRFTFLLVFLLPLLFSVNQVEARWWKDEKIRVELKLTENQTSEINKIFDEYQKKRKSLSLKIEKKGKELNEFLRSEDLDEKKVQKILDELLILQAENLREMVTMKVKVRKVLSKEQLKTLISKHPMIFAPSRRWAAEKPMFKQLQKDKPRP